MNKYLTIQNHPDIPDNYKYYWGYQFRLGEEVVVPYLSGLNAFCEGFRVMEIGSAEGGVLAALVQAGAKDALATDIAQNRLELGAKISGILELPIEFKYHNIMEDEIPEAWRNSADLVILRDVIEHLDDAGLALANIKKFLKPGGFLWVTFPPYYSPYGGHQHIVMNNWGKLPYIHYLPSKIFHKLVASGRPGDVGEVMRLKNIRLTPAKFMKAASGAGYSIFNSDYYFLRPVFRMKFGLPTVKITALQSLPFVKGFFSLEASYILQA
jgi:SAM-dependent methyltransferase